MSEQDARDFVAALGAEISAWRRRRKISRGELAAKVDISETTIGRIERGQAESTTDVWRIAAALDLNFSDMVRRAEESIELESEGSPAVQTRAARKKPGARKLDQD